MMGALLGQVLRIFLALAIVTLIYAFYLTVHYAYPMVLNGIDIGKTMGWVPFAVWSAKWFSLSVFHYSWIYFVAFVFGSELFLPRTFWVSLAAGVALYVSTAPIWAFQYSPGKAVTSFFILVCFGLLSGYLYWLIAGRHAGLWRKPATS
jgi:hypothetical protein